MSHLTLNPRSEIRLFESKFGSHMFLADGSRIFDVDIEIAEALASQIEQDIIPEQLDELLGRTDQTRYISAKPIAPPKLTSISLNVAQSCNMSCAYCYADEGRFGGGTKVMQNTVAQKAIDRLLAEAPPESAVVVGFMGGEPFLNRKLIHEAVSYATQAAKKSKHRVRFSITTNATLLRDEDVDLLKKHPFSVSVSLDGNQNSNDAQRKMARSRESAYNRALAGLTKLTKNGRPKHVSARATITPETGELLPLLEHLLSLDIDEAGFAPVVAAPSGQAAFDQEQMSEFLEQMVECGEVAKAKLLSRERFPVSNFETALHEIHRGTHRPYPCGAGAGYLSVNSDGDFYACHRLIDDEKFKFGDIETGLSIDRRAEHLAARHVDKQEPCRTCWARYLCGGGCYHEVENRGRIGCDYIRNWLLFCLSSYAEISKSAPDYFTQPNHYFKPARSDHE